MILTWPGRSTTIAKVSTAETYGRSHMTSPRRVNGGKPLSPHCFGGARETHRCYGRHAEALSSETLVSILEKTVAQVGRNDLEGAWSSAAGIPGVGFRFFTKWLWVAGVGAGLAAPPLVFDKRVRDSLQDAKWPFDRRRINERRRWVNYCEDAAAVGRTLGVRSEWVEYWLFSGALGADRMQ